VSDPSGVVLSLGQPIVVVGVLNDYPEISNRSSGERPSLRSAGEEIESQAQERGGARSPVAFNP
jgi:hypothetical protein